MGHLPLVGRFVGAAFFFGGAGGSKHPQSKEFSSQNANDQDRSSLNTTGLLAKPVVGENEQPLPGMTALDYVGVPATLYGITGGRMRHG
jgi:hypothetical protein